MDSKKEAWRWPVISQEPEFSQRFRGRVIVGMLTGPEPTEEGVGSARRDGVKPGR
jgi:hypothetical protein